MPPACCHRARQVAAHLECNRTPCRPVARCAAGRTVVTIEQITLHFGEGGGVADLGRSTTCGVTELRLRIQKRLEVARDLRECPRCSQRRAKRVALRVRRLRWPVCEARVASVYRCCGRWSSRSMAIAAWRRRLWEPVQNAKRSNRVADRYRPMRTEGHVLSLGAGMKLPARGVPCRTAASVRRCIPRSVRGACLR